MMWLTVKRSNNHPEIIFECGTENGVMAAMQCTFQQDAEAHKYGSSPVNQRIEGWWVFYRRNSFCKTRRKWLEHKKRA